MGEQRGSVNVCRESLYLIYKAEFVAVDGCVGVWVDVWVCGWMCGSVGGS